MVPRTVRTTQHPSRPKNESRPLDVPPRVIRNSPQFRRKHSVIHSSLGGLTDRDRGSPNLGFNMRCTAAQRPSRPKNESRPFEMPPPVIWNRTQFRRKRSVIHSSLGGLIDRD